MKDSVKKLLKKDGALNAIHSAVVRAYAVVSKEPIWSDKMLADEVLTQLYTQADEAEQAEPEYGGGSLEEPNGEKPLGPGSIPPKEPGQQNASDAGYLKADTSGPDASDPVPGDGGLAPAVPSTQEAEQSAENANVGDTGGESLSAAITGNAGDGSDNNL